MPLFKVTHMILKQINIVTILFHLCKLIMAKYRIKTTRYNQDENANYVKLW